MKTFILCYLKYYLKCFLCCAAVYNPISTTNYIPTPGTETGTRSETETRIFQELELKLNIGTDTTLDKLF